MSEREEQQIGARQKFPSQILAIYFRSDSMQTCPAEYMCCLGAIINQYDAKQLQWNY